MFPGSRFFSFLFDSHRIADQIVIFWGFILMVTYVVAYVVVAKTLVFDVSYIQHIGEQQGRQMIK